MNRDPSRQQTQLIAAENKRCAESEHEVVYMRSCDVALQLRVSTEFRVVGPLVNTMLDFAGAADGAEPAAQSFRAFEASIGLRPCDACSSLNLDSIRLLIRCKSRCYENDQERPLNAAKQAKDARDDRSSSSQLQKAEI